MTDFIEVNIRLKPFEPWADVLSQELADLGFESFSQEEPSLLAYIRQDKYDGEGLHKLLSAYKEAFSAELTENIIKSRNWNEEWESNFPPVVIEDKVYVRAPFHEARPDIKLQILLTPKMSFGTGHHATTSMMMEEMLSLDFKGKKVFDVGCGTAILAILSEMLGATDILAIDNDDWAVMNSLENTEINKCRKINVEKAEVDSVDKKGFNVILANINRNVIIEDISKYAGMLASNGHLLLSGFRIEDAADLEILAGSLGMTRTGIREKKEWCMLHLIKS